MNTCASLSRKFLAAVILTGQLKNDRTSERHLFEVTSIEYMLTQDCMLVDWAGGRSINASVSDPEVRRESTPEGLGS